MKLLSKIGIGALSTLILSTSLATVPAQAAETSNPINTGSRELVSDAYMKRYLPATKTPVNWTGNVSTCNAGTISADSLAKSTSVINFYRGLSGLDSISLDPQENAKAQKTALMMDANDALSHHPPSTWKCYTEEGADGASTSNIFGGTATYKIPNSAAAIDAYMNDYGSNNTAVGHRRWIQEPSTITMGLGSTDSAHALDIFDPNGSSSRANPQWVAFPNEGYFPSQLLPSSKRWSLSSDGANFSNATVSVKDRYGKVLEVKKLPVSDGYGLNTLVFEVTGVQAPQGVAENYYTVTVNGITNRDGRVISHVYTTRVFDATVAVPPHAATPSIYEGDLVAFDGSGTLWNYGKAPHSNRIKIGSGWSIMSDLHVTDWNKDKIQDIVAKAKDGNLYLYYGLPEGGFSRITLGAGWQNYEITLGKWDVRSELPSIMAKNNADGKLYNYPNPTGRNLGPRTLEGSGWANLGIDMLDWDANGSWDIVAKTKEGQLVLYKATGFGSFVNSPRTVIGNGWNTMNSVKSYHGYNGTFDTTQGLFARATDGTLYYYPATGTGWGARQKVGAGFGSYTFAGG